MSHPTDPAIADELTLEWGWRLRNVPGPELVYQVSEEDARRAVASNPRWFELVVRHVTAWSTEGAE